MIPTQVYRMLTNEERIRMQALIENNMINGFAEMVDKTVEWIQTPAARDYFYNRQGQINRFYRESGIEDEWNNIIHERATKGAGIAEQIYTYARQINTTEQIIEFNSREQSILDNICDSNYELVRNASEYEIQGIRRSILQDVAEGVGPRQTSLKEVQLQPINGLSPEQRAVMIARTETATITNTAALEQYKADGVEMVELVGGGVGCCSECEALIGEQIPVDEALEQPILHPNCECTWRAVLPPLDVPHPTEPEGWLNQ